MKKDTINILITVVITVFLCFVLVITIYNTSSIPLLNDSRDWISILGDVGKSLGAVALLALIIDLFNKRNDKIEKNSPWIRVTEIEFMNIADYTAVESPTDVFLEDDIVPQSITNQRIKNYSEYKDDIRSNGYRYLRMKVENYSPHPNAIAKSVKLVVWLQFSPEQNFATKRHLEDTEFVFPQKEITLDGLDYKNIYLKVSQNFIDKKKFIKGIIKSVECRNFENTVINSKRAKFDPVTFPYSSTFEDDEVVIQSSQQNLGTTPGRIEIIEGEDNEQA